MHPLINNIDEDVSGMLETWEMLKHQTCPKSDGMIEAIVYESAKNQVDCYAQDLRNSRLENNIENEIQFTSKFIETYLDFSRDYVFRTLKNS